MEKQKNEIKKNMLLSIQVFNKGDSCASQDQSGQSRRLRKDLRRGNIAGTGKNQCFLRVSSQLTDITKKFIIFLWKNW